MTAESLKIPVAALRAGLYVVELDRPWVDTPFLFQGFVIEQEDELDTLRAYCEHVFVDPERSDAEVLARVRSEQEGANAGRPVAAAPAAGDRAAAFGDAPFPGQTRFRELIRVAHAARTEARSAVDAAMRDVRLGHAPDVPALRETVADMTRVVMGNASAALWLTALKNRNEYTAIHCINVCILVLTLGRHLGMDARALRALGLGALLHDVGKARTPPEILDKSGKLTDEEFEIIKRHPEDGYQMVAEAGHVPRQTLDIIRLHHERLQGGGYPFGLTGDDIPQGVRMASIVDAYDAITSDRFYQKARPPDRAMKILFEERGSTFDRQLVEEFIRCIGIFPVGSVVELDTGAIGVVVVSNARAQLQPTILLLRTPEGEPFEKRLVVNLSAAAEDERARRIGHRIVRGLDPETAGIDVSDLAIEEFGLPDAVRSR